MRLDLEFTRLIEAAPEEWTVDFGPSPRELYRHRHVFEVIERPHRLVLASTETRLDGLSFGRSRSEEHTSELQSRVDLVCRLLLEKKKHSCRDPERENVRPSPSV